MDKRNLEANEKVHDECQYSSEEDPRFKICNRESLIIAILTVIFLYSSISVGQILGRVDPSDMFLVMGLPGWFFFSVVFCPMFFFGLVVLIIKFIFQDIPLD